MHDGAIMPEKSNELKEIKKMLANINRKLDQLLEPKNRRQQPARAAFESARAFVPKTLTSLPNHLRKTATAIATMGQATAKQVAAKTGRTRAAESDYLNQLASRGFLKKERKGREVHFLVFSLFTICPRCGTRVPMTLDQCPTCKTSLSNKK